MKKAVPFIEPVYTGSPLLPELSDFFPMLEGIWRSRRLTNNGELIIRLESELAKYLNSPHLSVFCNGTIALQAACKVLELTGEVITTPFTFAATSHALAICGLTPVFCDIEESTYNLDTNKIEELITAKTSAIMPVHVFGNPCRVDEISRIAEKHQLKVIYDAAHAFGVGYMGKPIGSFGDISMFSFHATKVYSTIEGGALVYTSAGLKKSADSFRNFGITADDTVNGVGINGKMNELQAAFGLLALKLVDEEISRRKSLYELYCKLFEQVPGIRLQKLAEGTDLNYSYFTVFIDKDEFGVSRDHVFEELRKYNIFSRRYFYPLCSAFSCYRHLPSAAPERLPAACKLSEGILALPIHGRLTQEDIVRIFEAFMEIRDRG